MMKCPVCGSTELKEDIKDLAYTFKGESTLIANVEGEFCAACEESLLGAEESDRAMKEMNAFNQRVISTTMKSNV